jgi:hypothetical protein
MQICDRDLVEEPALLRDGGDVGASDLTRQFDPIAEQQTGVGFLPLCEPSDVGT